MAGSSSEALYSESIAIPLPIGDKPAPDGPGWLDK